MRERFAFCSIYSMKMACFLRVIKGNHGGFGGGDRNSHGGHGERFGFCDAVGRGTNGGVEGGGVSEKVVVEENRLNRK